MLMRGRGVALLSGRARTRVRRCAFTELIQLQKSETSIPPAKSRSFSLLFTFLDWEYCSLWAPG